MNRVLCEELNRLDDSWEDIKEIIPYGCGLEAYRTLKRIISDFDVPFIVDADEKKWDKDFYGIKIVSPKLLNEKKGRKVVITVARRRYIEISTYLKNIGLREYVDFCHISQFVMEWYYKYRNEVCIMTMDIAVTTACTLNCKNCNMFIPHHKKNPIMKKFIELKKDIDMLFQSVDYIFAIGILGGEAFLNPDLGVFLEYLCDKFGDRIGSILITTNGVVPPSENMINILKQNNILVTISDYRGSINEKSDIENVNALLKENQIFSNIRSDLEWCDFGFPNNPLNLDGDAAAKHMQHCDPGWRGLADGRFYFCNCAWSAEKAGLIELDKEDYIDLSEQNNKENLLLYTIKGPSRGYMSMCKLCGGCGEDNKRYVAAGVQL